MRPFFAKLRLFEFMQNFDINVPMRYIANFDEYSSKVLSKLFNFHSGKFFYLL